ncbi:Erg28 like protein-domain-containing protein [Calycina marina]|uniref:Erg28 like protein-domain-containing protein n=1 Tax=Calycina marina TaxID=1763456 RepID=A0A9P7YY45_9HELO|nr:Erg28 like protein-domain-containing protein [Calycina marina]
MSSFLSTLSPYLPPHEGLLPKWLLFISIISIGNSIQAYSTLQYTSRVYSENPSLTPHQSTPLAPHSTATPLQGRTFGTWTLIQSLVRLYAAYNISNERFFELGFLTYAVAFCHFMAEWMVFRTAKWGGPMAVPVFVSTGTLVWMWLQWGFYVQ